MTKIEIKQRIESLEKEIKNKQNYDNIPLHASLTKLIKRMEIYYDNKIQPDIRRMLIEITTLQLEYRKPIRPRVIPPEEIQEWFNKWGKGMDFGYKEPYIRWISEDKKWVIITNPGGTSGTGTAMGTINYYYAPTEHILCRVTDEVTCLINETAKYEGKLTNSKIDEWKELIKTLS